MINSQQNYYPFFKNVKIDPEEAVQDQGLSFLDEFDDSDPENYCYGHNEIEKNGIDYDIFDNFEKRIENFKNKVQIFGNDTKDLL